VPQRPVPLNADQVMQVWSGCSLATSWNAHDQISVVRQALTQGHRPMRTFRLQSLEGSSSADSCSVNACCSKLDRQVLAHCASSENTYGRHDLRLQCDGTRNRSSAPSRKICYLVTAELRQSTSCTPWTDQSHAQTRQDASTIKRKQYKWLSVRHDHRRQVPRVAPSVRAYLATTFDPIHVATSVSICFTAQVR
jgi:hypothetical protein